MTEKYRTGTTIKKGRSKGQRRCDKWVESRLLHSSRQVFAAMERHACRSSLCDARFTHAQQDIKDAWVAYKAGKCDEVLVTCEHLDMIARKRD
jgi:hypothetical protein